MMDRKLRRFIAIYLGLAIACYGQKCELTSKEDSGGRQLLKGSRLRCQHYPGALTLQLRPTLSRHGISGSGYNIRILNTRLVRG